MNTSQFGSHDAPALDLGSPVSPRFVQQDNKDGALRPLVQTGQLSEEQKGYDATCEESYNFQRQILAAYAMYPDHLYAI